VGRIEAIRGERGKNASYEERSDDGERTEVADVDEVGDEDLDSDEREDERDRLVEVAEPGKGRVVPSVRRLQRGGQSA
jgi:hypothetical protein